MNKIILITAISLSFFIRGFLILDGKHIADIWHISRMGEELLIGNNPYLTLNFNVYPPLSLTISAISLILAQITKIQFYMIIKFWPNLADFATAFLIYKYLSKQKIKPLYAVFWSSLFLLNPISIIISAAHGQLDSVVSFLVVLAIYCLNSHSKLSALALGLSIAVKPNPLILIPLFLSIGKISIKARITYLLFVITPIVISLLPFLTHDPTQVIKNLINYSGVADFGYAAILRGIWFQNNADTNLPIALTNGLLSTSKVVLLVGAIILTYLFSGWKNLVKSILAIYLLFISLYFGISAQYLSWITPLAIMAREKLVTVYILSGTIALIGFYLYFGPDVLLGKLVRTMLPFENKYIYYYFFGNLILWVICLMWLGKTIIYYLRLEFNKFSYRKKQLLILGGIILIIALIPLLREIQNFLNIYGSLEK